MTLPPTTGAPLNLYLPAFDYGINVGDDTWDIVANFNWKALNNFASSALLAAPLGSQTVIQPAATYFNVNFPLIYTATNPTIKFGTAAGVWDSALTRTAAGAFSLDSNAIGNSGGNLKLNLLNAVSGFQFNGAAPAGYVLVGNGTEYIGQAITSSFNYQTVQAAGVSKPTESKLNFLAPLTVTDNPGNGSSDVGLAASGVTAGSYTSANITVGADGRVSAASSNAPTGTTLTSPGNSLGTTYTNSSSVPRLVIVTGSLFLGVGHTASLQARVGVSSPSTNVATASITNSSGLCCVTFMVPPSYKYGVFTSNGFTGETDPANLYSWVEL